MRRLPTRPRPLRAPVRGLFGCAVALVAAVACGVPPELQEDRTAPRPGPTSTGPTSTGPTSAAPEVLPTAPDAPVLPPPALPSFALPPGTWPPTPPAPPTTTPTTPGPTGPAATDCGGQPSGEAVLRTLRGTPGLLPDDVRLQVHQGPFCAGTWQFTTVRVLAQPEPEPLQVVTRGRPQALTLVTAGTEVCSLPVRSQAPPGIRALACDGGPLPTVVP